MWEGGQFCVKKKSRLSVRDELYNSNQPIHLDLIIIFLTLSLRITCNCAEGHWGDLGQLTHRHRGPTNPRTTVTILKARDRFVMIRHTAMRI